MTDFYIIKTRDKCTECFKLASSATPRLAELENRTCSFYFTLH